MKPFEVLILRSRSSYIGDVYTDKEEAKVKYAERFAKNPDLWVLEPGAAVRSKGKVFLLVDITHNMVEPEMVDSKPTVRERDIDDDIADMARELRARGVTLAGCRRTIFDVAEIIPMGGNIFEVPLFEVQPLLTQVQAIAANKRAATSEAVLMLLKPYSVLERKSQQ